MSRETLVSAGPHFCLHPASNLMFKNGIALRFYTKSTQKLICFFRPSDNPGGSLKKNAFQGLGSGSISSKRFFLAFLASQIIVNPLFVENYRIYMPTRFRQISIKIFFNSQTCSCSFQFLDNPGPLTEFWNLDKGCSVTFYQCGWFPIL